MNKQKLLSAAVAAAIAAAGSAAQAVSLSTDGRGDVLIFPYYSVRNGFDTYISFTNTTADTKAVRVRFRESENGQPVYDLNVYMPPNDTWAAAVVDNGSGARLLTADTTCATHAFTDTTFVNAYYSGSFPTVSRDAGPFNVDRTREGMIEVIDMGVVPPTATGGLGVTVVELVQSNAQGVPANCAALQARTGASGSQYVLDLTGQLQPPSGGLVGAGYLVNSNAGLEFGFEPVALTDFARSATGGIWYQPGDTRPNFNNALPRESRLLAYRNAAAGASSMQLLVDTWPNGNDAVSALLMTADIENNYVLERSTASMSEWIVTLPTKYDYVNNQNGPTLASAIAPFQRPFAAAGMTGYGAACDDFTMMYLDRDARLVPVTPNQIGFPTPPSSTPTSRTLCKQANVLRFRPKADIAGSLFDPRSPSFEVAAGWENGYARLNFTNPSTIAPIRTRTLVGSANVFNGLPAVGFMVQTFTRAGLVINGVPSSSGYAGNFTHKYRRVIQAR